MPENDAQSNGTPGAETDAEHTVESLTAEVAKWRDHARLWETRATENKATADALTGADTRATEAEQKLAEFEAKVTAAEGQITELSEKASGAESLAARYAAAVEFGITKADADLFLTGADADTLTAQAERLAARTGSRAPAPIPQGKGTDGPRTAAQAFGDFLDERLSG